MTKEALLPGLNVLGIGYDARGRYADPDSLEIRVVTLGNEAMESTKFGAYPADTVQYTEVQRGSVESIYGQSIEDYASSLKGKFKISGKYSFFEAEAEASFSHAEKRSQELQFMTVSRIQQGYKLSLVGSAKDWWTHLHPAFRRDVMEMEPRKLFDTYGTHVLTHIFIGGKSQCSFTASKSSNFNETEFRAAITAKYESLKAGVAVSADATVGWSSKKAAISSNYGLKLIGGDPDCDSIDSWRKTVAANPVLIDFAHDGLAPLYEFCPDEARRKELHEAFDRMFAIPAREIVLRIFSQGSTEVVAHPAATCEADRSYKVISGGATCSSISSAGQLLTAMYPATSGNPTAWIARSKDQEEDSPGNVAAYCIALYDPDDEWEVKVFEQVSAKGTHPEVSASVGPGYVMVGGGAFCDYEEPGNLLQASYPRDNATWAASAVDRSPVLGQRGHSDCVLHVYAIGLRRKDGSDHGLTTHIFSATSDSVSHPKKELQPSDPDFTVIAGGARIATAAQNFLTASRPRADGGTWFASAADHMQFSPVSITVYALGLKGVRVRYAKTDREVAG
ncbi:MAG: MAC/perforin domain-containing protein [Rhodospirillaceae bacterium]